jgi:hypothetical protein
VHLAGIILILDFDALVVGCETVAGDRLRERIARYAVPAFDLSLAGNFQDRLRETYGKDNGTAISAIVIVLRIVCFSGRKGPGLR